VLNAERMAKKEVVLARGILINDFYLYILNFADDQVVFAQKAFDIFDIFYRLVHILSIKHRNITKYNFHYKYKITDIIMLYLFLNNMYNNIHIVRIEDILNNLNY